MRTRSPTGLPAMNASATDTEAEGPVAPDPTTDAGQRLLRLQVDILIGHLPGMVLGTTVLSSGAALILLHQGMGVAATRDEWEVLDVPGVIGVDLLPEGAAIYEEKNTAKALGLQ